MSARRDEGVWLPRARAFVAKLTADLPADATLADRRKAIRGKGGPFHGYTRWGRLKYGQACREYLERHGQPPRKSASVEAAPNFGPDIIFPYRSPTPETPKP